MKYKWFKYHILFFTITWIFNYVFNFYFKIPEGKVLPFTLFFIVEYLFLIGYFYCILYLSQFVLKKLIYFIPFLLLIMLVSCSILSFAPFHFYLQQGLPIDYSKVYFLKLFEVSYITFSSIGFLFLQKWDESLLQKEQLLESLSDAELKFLRSQMSPHFLLNTLNSIYSLALNKSPETYIAISELKALYSHVQKYDSKVSLKNEIEYLENFIKIQKRRVRDSVQLQVDISLDQDYQIEPLLLSSFIENAFKHGVSMKEPSFISVELIVINGLLEYTIRNSDHSSKYKDSTSGIGLQNLSRRLDLLYPKKFTLEGFHEGKSYVSKLKINLV
jgi:sensor histidine kinase YesM